MTYTAERFTGFDRVVPAVQWVELRKYSDYAQQLPALSDRSGPDTRFPAATGEVGYRGKAWVCVKTDRFDATTERTDAEFEDRFITAASPGAIVSYIRNGYYDTRREYLAAVTSVMQTKCDLITEAGFTLRIDSPDLLGGDHLKLKDRSKGAFVDVTRAHIDALNDALTNVPAD